ncbi:hypothetical protein Golax_017740, partial [Gossypium laxum]|nr:hypothetical protein [Gossypium laxum]
MMVAESVVKLGLRKDKLVSFESEKRGVCWQNHMRDNGNGNGDGDNGKPQKCPKKFVFSEKDKSEGKGMRLRSSTKGAEAKEGERENKLVECFLCHGPHRLQKCLKTIENDDASDEEPKKLGLSKG